MGEKRDYSAIEQQAAKFEMTDGLERAMDLSYQRLVATAKAEWERRFSGKHPSDACVKVRVGAAELKARTVPGSGFLKRGKTSQRAPRTKLPFPRLAR
jgi:hypothetical protein